MIAVPARRSAPAGLPKPMIWALAALGVLILIIVAWQLRPKPPVEPYRTAEVSRGDLTRSVSASGTLQALITVQVGSQVSGQIESVLVDFNSPVKKGQVLALIDPTPYLSRVRQAQADLGAQNATLDQQQAALQQAEAQVAVDKATYDRTVTLTQRGYDSASSLETAEATFKRSEAGVGSARAMVETQRARIVQSKAALEASELDLAHTRIVSPIDGVVVNRSIDPGQTVQASFQTPTLFQIAQDLSKVQVKILVDEADIGQVHEGQAVKFTVDAYPDQPFTGVVTQVRKQPETQSNVVSYEVIAQADNPKGQLLPGMTANADILIDEERDVLRVPNAALRFKPVLPHNPAADLGMPDAATLKAMKLTPAQRDQFRQIYMSAVGKSFSTGGDREAQKEVFKAAAMQFDADLTPAQKAIFEPATGLLKPQPGGPKLGTVYVLKNGAPVAVQVVVGATDGTLTEVTGPLAADATVIVGGGPKAPPKVVIGGPR
jgi:HlyD family secretion protein